MSFVIVTRKGSAAAARDAGRYVDCYTCGRAFPTNELGSEHAIAEDHPDGDVDDGGGIVLLGLVCPACMYSSPQDLRVAIRANAARLARVATYLDAVADAPPAELTLDPNAA
jgi:hypothetical protein